MSDSRKIVVCDDDYTSRTLIVDYFEDEGYQVHAFSDPDQIGDEITGADVLIMDVRYPGKPIAGITYVLDSIERGKIDPSSMGIVFITRWGAERKGLPELLEKIPNHQWHEIRTGLEFTELRKVVMKVSES